MQVWRCCHRPPQAPEISRRAGAAAELERCGQQSRSGAAAADRLKPLKISRGAGAAAELAPSDWSYNSFLSQTNQQTHQKRGKSTSKLTNRAQFGRPASNLTNRNSPWTCDLLNRASNWS
uniref:Uncharacterized protein n=1 Tax=Kalanchoe fedtschenkoi TaxID=63787 RepID=A0A7N0VCG0_KALFE